MAKKAKEIFKMAQESLPVKDNYTFRLEAEVMAKFRKYCKAHNNISMSHVVETFLKDLVSREK